MSGLTQSPQYHQYMHSDEYYPVYKQWDSLFIPMVPSDLMVEARLKDIIENDFKFGVVRRIDYSKKLDGNSHGYMAFVHFESWDFNNYTVSIRNHIERFGHIDLHYVEKNGIVTKYKYVRFMINLNPIKETERNAHQLADDLHFATVQTECMEVEIQNLQEKIKLLTEKNDTLQNTIDNLSDELQFAMGEIEAKEGKIQRLEENNKTLSEKNELLHRTIDSLSDNIIENYNNLLSENESEQSDFEDYDNCDLYDENISYNEYLEIQKNLLNNQTNEFELNEIINNTPTKLKRQTNQPVYITHYINIQFNENEIPNATNTSTNVPFSSFNVNNKYVYDITVAVLKNINLYSNCDCYDVYVFHVVSNIFTITFKTSLSIYTSMPIRYDLYTKLINIMKQNINIKNNGKIYKFDLDVISNKILK